MLVARPWVLFNFEEREDLLHNLSAGKHSTFVFVMFFVQPTNFPPE